MSGNPADELHDYVGELRSFLGAIGKRLPPVRANSRGIVQEPRGLLSNSTLVLNDAELECQDGKVVGYIYHDLLRIDFRGLKDRPGKRYLRCWAASEEIRLRIVTEGFEKYALSELGAKCVWESGTAEW